MNRSIRRSLFAALFLLLGALSACDQPTEPNELLPTGPDPLLGALLGKKTSGGTLGGYTLANDRIIPNLLSQPLKLTQIIGVNGGTIEVLGHTLIVPRGTVLQPTLFVVNVLPTGYVEVYLTATLNDLLGGILNIGSRGFSQPVTVTLTYSRSTNIPDPTKLIILREKGPDGRPEPLPSEVDLVRKTVTAKLDHFSRYFIAFPN